MPRANPITQRGIKKERSQRNLTPYHYKRRRDGEI